MPIIPFLNSAEDIVFGLYIIARLTGIFLLSPLLSHVSIPPQIRVFLILFCSVLMGMVIYPQYRGQDPTYVLRELQSSSEFSLLLLVVTMGKELAIGYLLGFVFNLLFEALLLAGQLVGVVIGFSIAELLDPVTNTPQSLLGNFFMVFASMLFLALDFHHVVLRLAAESFHLVPMGSYHMPFDIVSPLTAGTGKIYTYSLSFGAIPFVILILITIALGFMGRVMPEMNIFMVGFPLRIYIGYFALILSIPYFPQILEKAMAELQNLAGVLLHLIGTGEPFTTSS